MLAEMFEAVMVSAALGCAALGCTARRGAGCAVLRGAVLCGAVLCSRWPPRSFHGMVVAPPHRLPSPPTTPPQGAVYLDGDLDAVRRCYMSHFPLPANPLSLIENGQAGGGGGSQLPSPWE